MPHKRFRGWDWFWILLIVIIALWIFAPQSWPAIESRAFVDWALNGIGTIVHGFGRGV